MANMLNQSSLSQSFYMSLSESVIPVFFCLFVTLMLPKLRTGIGTFLTLMLLGGFIIISSILDPFSDFWLEISLPVMILIAGYFIVVANRILTAKKTSKETATDISEDDRTLGLFYQQQGMLDMAFEKFRSFPRKGDVNDLLYKLGLEYEKKGQIIRALGVYKLIVTGERDDDDMGVSIPMTEDMETDRVIGSQSDIPVDAPLEADTRSTIGRFEISEVIEREALGRIFRGQDSETGTHAAIKTVEFSGLDDDHISEIRDRFFRETECLAQLIHSNIVTVYECGEEPGMFYIATEDLEGEELKNYTKKDQLLPIREALSIIGHAAEALDYAHGKNVIHQHVRPDNIIWMKKTRHVKMKDFKIAWIPSAFSAKTDALKESHLYMSPEQIAGKKVDGRSDVFSLGVVLFEMLTGERPFLGEDMPSVMLKISKEKHLSPRFYNPKIPRVIEKIIDRALEKDLQKRYQSAGQMAIHLKRVVARINELMEQKRALGS